MASRFFLVPFLPSLTFDAQPELSLHELTFFLRLNLSAAEMETVHPATGMETVRPATGTETARMATETAVRLAIEMADPLATGTADRSAETIIPEMIIPTASIRQPLLLR